MCCGVTDGQNGDALCQATLHTTPQRCAGSQQLKTTISTDQCLSVLSSTLLRVHLRIDVTHALLTHALVVSLNTGAAEYTFTAQHVPPYSTCQVTALHWRTLRSDTQTDSTMFNFNVLSVRRHIRILPDMSQLQLQLHLP